MSVQIFYELRAVRILGDALSREQDVFVLCFLSGDSRTYTWAGKREKRWTSPVLGTYDDVMAHQLTWVASEMYWKTNGASGCLRDFQWLTKARKALNSAIIVTTLPSDARALAVDGLVLTPHRRCEGMTVRGPLMPR